MSTHVEQVMGMPVSVGLRDRDVDVAPVFAWLREVDAVFSLWREDSELSLLREVRHASPMVREVLNRCEALRIETGGGFDAWAGGRLDPSGLVKGWAVERAAALLWEAGGRNFCLNAGGDVCVRGRPEPAGGAGWRVGVQHPFERGSLAAVVELTDGGVATSGHYERGEHILDPRTGAPARNDVVAVTVLGPDLGTADAYATAAFVLGPEWTAGLPPGYGAMTVLHGGRVVTTPGFRRASRPIRPSEPVGRAAG